MSKTTAASLADSNDIGLDIIGLATDRLAASGKIHAPLSAAARKTDPDSGTDDDEPEAPAREEGEDDAAYAARLTEAGFDPDEHIQPAESDEDRTARLQQEEGESDDDYDARLAEEGLSRDDVPAVEELSEEEKKAAAQKIRDEADLKKLPEAARKAAQAVINKRIGQITAKSKAKETADASRIAALEAELAEAKEAADGQPAKATVVTNVHPLLLDPSEDAIAKYVAGVEAFEDWAAEHEDGYEPTAEDAAKGYKPATKAEIRQRLRLFQRERDQVVAKARDHLAKRTSAEAEARKLLPAFFDATQPEYQAARSLLREQPELKRFPDYMTRAAEIVLGRKALADLKTAAVKPKPKTPAPRASRAPGAGGAAKGGFAERKRGMTDAPEAVRQFAKSPTRENLATFAGSFLET